MAIIVMQVVSVVAATQLIHKFSVSFCKQKVGNLAVLEKKSGKMRGLNLKRKQHQLSQMKKT